MTPAQRQKVKVSWQLKANKKIKENVKRKEAEEFSKLEVDFERLKKKHKPMSKKNKSITDSSLTCHMVLLEQPVWGSATYSKNDQIRPAALLAKEHADAAKYKAQAEKVKVQAEQDKAQTEWTKRKPDRVSRTISKV